MTQVLLVVHLLIALALVGVIMVQRSEGGGLGIGGGGGMGGLMSARGSANLLTRTTAILAGCFMATSVLLAILAGGHSKPRSIIDAMPPAGPAAPVQPGAPAIPAPAAPSTAPVPAAPATPAAPVAQ